MSSRGHFITFEGVDGAGKTTQARRLVDSLVAAGTPAVYYREPGGCALGEELRNVLLRTTGPAPSRRTELLLFGAARAQVVHEIVEPELAAGKIVVLDRFIDTTVAYQGFGRGLDLTFIDQMNAFAIGDTVPELTFMLFVSEGESERRRLARGEAADRFESEDTGFRERIREGYLRQASKYTDRIQPIDAGLGPDAVFDVITHVYQTIAAGWQS